MASKSVMAALSVSLAEPRFSCGQDSAKKHSKPCRFAAFVEFEFSRRSTDLLAVELLVDEELHLLHVFRGVVGAAGGRQAVPAGSPGLLVVAGQGLGQVPVRHKSAGADSTLQTRRGPKVQLGRVAASPDVGLVHSHPEADGGDDDRDFALRPLVLDLCAILQACSAEAGVEHQR